MNNRIDDIVTAIQKALSELQFEIDKCKNDEERHQLYLYIYNRQEFPLDESILQSWFNNDFWEI